METETMKLGELMEEFKERMEEEGLEDHCVMIFHKDTTFLDVLNASKH